MIMKNKIIKYLGLCTLGLFTFFSSNAQDVQGVEKTANGLKYKFFVQNKEGKKPIVTDFVTIVAYYQATDTIFFDSRKSPTPYVFPVMERTYKGDLFEGLQLMSAGDSAVFLLSADSLFLKTFRVKELPRYIKKGSVVKAFVKMLKMQPGEEFKKDLQAKFDAETKKQDLEKAKEDSALKVYLKEKGITAKPTKNGLYYVEVQKGTGPVAIAGTKVKVHYTGTLLNGKKFDSSVDRNQPFEFDLGKGQVIKGWDEGIALMSVGGKAKLIIPSKLGYAERGAPPTIAPFSTLVFDVELLDVKQVEVKK